MKRVTIVFGFCFILLTISAQQEQLKRGLGFGVLPAVSYDSDLGFQYGALVNFYLYGSASRFPDYNHSLYLELSTYTKGT